jgi:serine/threonine protein kinase/WD40 repeat protein
MSIKTRCPNTNCDARFVVTEEQLGKTARCKKCGMRFKVTRGVGDPLSGPTSQLAKEPQSQPAAPAVTQPLKTVQPQEAVTQPVQSVSVDTSQIDGAATQADTLVAQPAEEANSSQVSEQTQFAEEGSAGSSPGEHVETVDPAVTQFDPRQRETPETNRSTGDPGVETARQKPSPKATPSAPQSADEKANKADPTATMFASQTEDPAALEAAEDDVPRHWNVGDVILDLYEVIEHLGAGNFGDVHKVHHRNWNIDLAVKTPKRGDFTDVEQDKKTAAEEAAFIDECERWIDLGLHPNIVTCHYVRRLGGVPRVFAEYVDGGSLQSWINDRQLYEGDQKKALERLLDMTIQFAWGLGFAHEKGLVHQDIKPENVMMTQDGTPKLADFGLGHGGTPAYCSPEQAEGRELTLKTDIWSWGLCILEMFAGERTWSSGTAAPEVFEDYLEAEPEHDSTAKMPDALADLLQRCFQLEPDRRPQDMGEITEKLKEVYQHATNEKYFHEEPKAVELLADGLNNRALSMLDLGRSKDAERLFDEALRADAHHPEATYNRGLILWRSGRLTDNTLIYQLEGPRDANSEEWRVLYLLALVHIERGDTYQAKQILEAIPTTGQSAPEVRSLLSRLDSEPICGPPERVIRFTASASFESASFSRNGRFVWLQHDWRELRKDPCVIDIEREAMVRDVAALQKKQDNCPNHPAHEKVCSQLERNDAQHIYPLIRHSPDGSSFMVSLVPRKVYREGQAFRFYRAIGQSYVPTGELHLPPDSPAMSWALCGDGVQAFMAGDDGTITLRGIDGDSVDRLGRERGKVFIGWNPGVYVNTNQRVCQHPGQVLGLAASDGDLLVSSGTDCTVCIWVLQSQRCVRTIIFDRPAKVVALSRDSNRLAVLQSEYGRHVLTLWNLDFGTTVPWAFCIPRPSVTVDSHRRIVDQHVDHIERAMSSESFQEAASVLKAALQIPSYARDQRLLELQMALGRRAHGSEGMHDAWLDWILEEGNDPTTSAALASDASLTVTGTASGKICFWDQTRRVCKRKIDADIGRITDIVISPDKQLILVAGQKSAVRLWDCEAERFIGAWGEYDGISVTAVAFLPGRKTAVALTKEGLRLHNVQTGKCVRSITGGGWGTCLAISPDGRCALTGTTLWPGNKGNPIVIWNLEKGEVSGHLFGHMTTITCVSFLPDGSGVVSGSWNPRGIPGDSRCVPSDPRTLDNSLRVWDLRTGHEKLRLDCRDAGGICSATVCSDGRFAFIGTGRAMADDGRSTIRLIDLRRGKCVRTLFGHGNPVVDLALAEESQFLLSVSGATDDFFGVISDNPKGECSVRQWKFFWNYKISDSFPWNDGATPYLETFLTLRTPYADNGISRVGQPVWNDNDFDSLVKELQNRGYGWLRPEGVRKKLEEMTANWQSPPPLPWDSSGSSESKARSREVIVPRTKKSAETERARPTTNITTNIEAAPIQKKTIQTARDVSAPTARAEHTDSLLVRGIQRRNLGPKTDSLLSSVAGPSPCRTQDLKRRMMLSAILAVGMLGVSTGIAIYLIHPVTQSNRPGQGAVIAEVLGSWDLILTLALFCCGVLGLSWLSALVVLPISFARCRAFFAQSVGVPTAIPTWGNLKQSGDRYWIGAWVISPLILLNAGVLLTLLCTICGIVFYSCGGTWPGVAVLAVTAPVVLVIAGLILVRSKFGIKRLEFQKPPTRRLRMANRTLEVDLNHGDILYWTVRKSVPIQAGFGQKPIRPWGVWVATRDGKLLPVRASLYSIWVDSRVLAERVARLFAALTDTNFLPPTDAESGSRAQSSVAKPTAKTRDSLKRNGIHTDTGVIDSHAAGRTPVIDRNGSCTCGCGKENPPTNTFCVTCGKRLPEANSAICPHCANSISANVAFCIHCGKPVTTEKES